MPRAPFLSAQVEEKWRSTDFQLAKYSKNGEFRGYVLRSSEDIKVDLEDHMLNLQTMAGSRFVVIFQDQVRRGVGAVEASGCSDVMGSCDLMCNGMLSHDFMMV